MKSAPFRNWPIALKLNALLLPALAAVLCSFALICNAVSYHHTGALVTTQLQMQTESAVSAMDAMVDEVTRMSLVVYSNKDIRKDLQEALLTPDAFTSSRKIDFHKKTLLPTLSVMESPNKYMVRLYPASDKIFCDYDYTLPIASLPRSLNLEEMVQKGFGATFYTVDDIKKQDVASVLPPYRALLIAHVLYPDFSSIPLGVLCSEIRVSYLESTVRPYLEQENGVWYRLTLDGGEMLFANGSRTDSSIVVSVPLSSFPGTLEIGFPDEILRRQTRAQSTLFFTCALLLMPLCCLLILRLSRIALRRFSAVIRKYRQLSAETDDLAPPLEGLDEAAQLDQSFSQLYQDYRSSLKNAYELKIRHRQLETNLLLSKINPHFLYNTLSAIKWSLPRDEGEVIDRLIALYRGMLGQGKDAAILEHELETLDQYVALQRYTYSRMIDYSVEADEGIRRAILPKFLLQPVIENAILYGTAENYQCSIHLRAFAEKDRLIIRIRNGGKSINENVSCHLNELNEMPLLALSDYIMAPDDRHSYGIFNIITRIRLLFGSGYGLWHEIPEEGGTEAIFILPLAETPETYRAKVKIE